MNNPFDKFDNYGIKHLPTHLIHSELWDDLVNILTNFYFIETKSLHGLTYGLVNDYYEALKKIPENIL